MPVIVRLSSYLKKLREEEEARPKSQRREVPTLDQLAVSIGVHQSTLSRISSGVTRKIDIDLLGEILKRLRQLGFPATVGDILDYQDDRPPAAEAAEEA